MSYRGVRRCRLAALILAGASIAGAAGVAPTAQAATTAQPPQSGPSSKVVEHTACARPTNGGFRCLALWHRQKQSAPTGGEKISAAAVSPPATGIGPADIQAAYSLPTTAGKGQTVAIVDAYDNPNVESDLKAYRAAWKLPACTSANKCFTKVNQRGTKAYPPGDSGWGVEIDLDAQAVSAACPACKILLVESDDESLDSIGAAVNTAVRLGATVVSNSYGQDEFNGAVATGKKYYTHPGVAMVASSGDDGFQAASYPAALPYVWAAGGTFLQPTAKGGWSEEAWQYAGSGCSAWFSKPKAQRDKNCRMRTVADVSAMADGPAGFAVYDTYGLGADNGWLGVSGTSVSAPLISGMIGLAGNAAAAAQPSYAYAHRSGLHDVVGGSNGYCGGDYLCTGLKGYDGPTGLGSPRGVKSL